MTVKTILTEPNKLLRQVSLPVEKVRNEERRLMDDMLETMYEAKGIGLAAIQIGVPKRIIVMDISKDDEKILKLTISSQHERNIEDLKLSDHSLKKEHGSFVLRFKVPYNYLQIDDYELKAIELLGIKKEWLTDISMDNSFCKH